MGIENLIVVETPDAVLAADKTPSQDIKHIVTQLQKTKREERTLHRKVHRPCGWYNSIGKGCRVNVKRIKVKPKASISLQKYHHRAEHRIVVTDTAEITRALVRIKLGLQDCFYFGNVDPKPDRGLAKNYVEMQWLMLQQEKPEDFVIATSAQYCVRDFVNAAAKELSIEIRWEEAGVNEMSYDNHNNRLIAVDPSYFRPTEVETLLGHSTKAKDKLGWKPSSAFDELVTEMVREELNSAERDELVKHHGYRAMEYHD